MIQIYISNAAPDLQVFSQAKTAGKEIFKVIKRNPAISYESNGKILENIKGDIEMREVHFAYPSREDKPVLQGFSLAIQAGNIVALVGSSGCGKSTVISLVQRFYDPITGKIIQHLSIFAETIADGCTLQLVHLVVSKSS